MGSTLRRSLAAAGPLLLLWLFSAEGTAGRKKKPETPEGVSDPELQTVDCLLPATTRRIGRVATLPTPRKLIRTTAEECEMRHGEWEYDPGDLESAISNWMALAMEGDPEAQTRLGERFEKGIGIAPDYEQAALWYRRAAEQGYSRAQVNLALLYEQGLGVEQDRKKAFELYRDAAGLSGAFALDSGGELIDPAEVERLREEIESMDRETQELRQRARDLELALEASHKELEAKEREETELQSQVEAARRQLREVSQAANADRQEIERLREELESSERQLDSVSAEVAERRAKVDQQEQALGREREQVATSEKMSKATMERMARLKGLEAPGAAAGFADLRSLDLGPYFALVIGNSSYLRVAAVPTAVPDARALARLLEARYGFVTRLVENAARETMIAELGRLRKEIGENQNLLIFYAGHGRLSEETGEGYWLPVDARPDDPSTWIGNPMITRFLETVQARHILIVADSLYLGGLQREVGGLEWRPALGDRRDWIEKIAASRSREALTSGEARPRSAPDESGTSVFARALREALEENSSALETRRLKREISQRVGAASTPEHTWLAGQLAGEFFFLASR